ncbi:hypothetical protein FB567DRAFT_526514 [Paraphoma chrysanthemicola]|uniref:Zn(2)-C6 fungal-type domain-containing protein n=1 Tax=Paraphoma chrysanthemicola TaxID=798071 RepID=A0A8K0VYX2_9PLEO|nr:hypothetical protein FB567DRAFT_526514 [Paraphoma chrysanthemicola]
MCETAQMPDLTKSVSEPADDEHMEHEPALPPRCGSCTTCAKAKSKCIRRRENPICVRCERLRKECHIREPMKRKRKANSGMTKSSTRMKSLETKLEDIANALKINRVHATPVATSSVGIATQSSAINISGNITDNTSQTPVQDDIPSKVRHEDFIVLDPFSSKNSEGYLDDSARLSSCGLDILLDRYMRLMAPHMPFVILAADTRASDLGRTKPFLLQAIAVVASFHDTETQQILGKQFVRDLCDQVFVNGEKSLSLLQGLLVFINWFNPHVYLPQSSTNLLHLAMALVTDLGIDRASSTCEKTRLDAAAKPYVGVQSSKIVSNDERRALLGTFHVTSTITTSFRKPDRMIWTPWMTDCSCALMTNRDFESDIFLVQLVGMQRIVQETINTGKNTAPCTFYAKSFLAELNALDLLPEQDSKTLVARLQLLYAQVAIWQRSFIGIDTDRIDGADLRLRLNGMWQCMEATKAFLSAYLDIPIAEYPIVPFGVFAQFAYVFVVIARALSVVVCGWDVEAVSEYAQFSSIMKHAITRFENVAHSEIDSVRTKGKAFANWALRIRTAKDFYDGYITAISSAHQSNPTHTGNDETSRANNSIQAQHSQELMNTLVDPTLSTMVDYGAFWDEFSDSLQASVDFGIDFEMR